MNAEAAAQYVAIQIRLRRRFVGLTVAQLARTSGVSAEQIKDVEAGRAAISWPNLTRIASALGCEVSTLFEGLA